MQNKRKSYQSNKATGTKYVSPSISVSEGYRGAVPSGRYGNARQMLSEEAYAAGPYGGSYAPRVPSGTPAKRRKAEAGRGDRPAAGKKTYRYGETASPGIGKKTRKKRRLAKIYLFLAIITVAVSVVLALTVFFKVDEIEVRGNSRYGAHTIIEHSGIKIGDNLLLMDKFSSIGAIKQNLNYIKDVQIRRSFPNKVIINVTEVTVAAAFDANGAYWLCDDMGTLLELTTNLPANAAVITGAQLSGSSPGQYFKTSDESKQQPLWELFTALRENELFGLIYSIDISKIYDIKINYLDRYEISLGNSGDFENSCKRLRKLIFQLEQEGNLKGKIDISGGEMRFIAG